MISRAEGNRLPIAVVGTDEAGGQCGEDEDGFETFAKNQNAGIEHRRGALIFFASGSGLPRAVIACQSRIAAIRIKPRMAKTFQPQLRRFATPEGAVLPSATAGRGCV